MSQVVKLHTAKVVAPTKVKATRQLHRQGAIATVIGGVALVLTGLSLNHLASGITVVTGCPMWQGWAMGVGIDLGFVALELAQLMVGQNVLRQIAAYANPAIVGTLAGSAALNAMAFASQASNPWQMAAGIALGVAIPALVYALTKVAAAMVIGCHR